MPGGRKDEQVSAQSRGPATSRQAGDRASIASCRINWRKLSQINAELLGGEKNSSVVTETDFHQLDQFVPARAGNASSCRCWQDASPIAGRTPDIPSRSVGLSLVLGEVVKVPSFLQLEEETKLPQWQRWVGYQAPISHDTFGYASNRMNPQKLSRASAFINRRLKRGKAFEESKTNGLLAVSLDANEQFCSDHRCWEDCLSREVTCKDETGPGGQETQYYHKAGLCPAQRAQAECDSGLRADAPSRRGMRGGLEVATPDAPDLRATVFRFSGGGLLVC